MKFGILILAIFIAHPEVPIHARTFTSPDGAFRFVYPQTYLVKTEWNADEISASYIPVCIEGAICVVTRRDAYKGTNFQAAAFDVLQIENTSTQDSCLSTFSSNRGANETHKVDVRKTTAGVTFTHLESTDAGVGNYRYSDLYRTFHKGKCYELSVNIATSSYGNFDPGTIKEFTKEDTAKVREDLTSIVDSFRFLK
jgi:hypothetical protein